MAAKKRPVGHPRTSNPQLPPGETLSGNPPRPRITAGPKRDQYVYRAKAEARLGRKLPTNTVLDHAVETLASKRNPNAKVTPESRSANSHQGGGLSHSSKEKKRGR